MLEIYTKQIKTSLNSFINFFAEDKEAQKKNYYEKLDKVLNLTIKFFDKYGETNIHNITFYDNFQKKQTYFSILMSKNSEVRWVINYQNNQNSKDSLEKDSINNQELINYCWTNKVDITSFIKELFNYIKRFFSGKEETIKREKDRYNTEIACLNEAIENLQELIDTEISEDIRNK